jgi:hypothetical protein
MTPRLGWQNMVACGVFATAILLIAVDAIDFTLAVIVGAGILIASSVTTIRIASAMLQKRTRPSRCSLVGWCWSVRSLPPGSLNGSVFAFTMGFVEFLRLVRPGAVLAILAMGGVGTGDCLDGLQRKPGVPLASRRWQLSASLPNASGVLRNR